MELSIGKLKVKLKQPAALDAVGFVPLFARYVDKLNELPPAKDPEVAAINRERIMLSFFRSLDDFSKKELLKYMASLIEEWSLDEKPSEEALAKLPPLALLALFDAVAMLTLFGGEQNVNFFADR